MHDITQVYVFTMRGWGGGGDLMFYPVCGVCAAVPGAMDKAPASVKRVEGRDSYSSSSQSRSSGEISSIQEQFFNRLDNHAFLKRVRQYEVFTI